MLQQVIDNLFNSVERGVLVFLGLLCLLVFSANAGLLIWIIFRKGGDGLARCPRCGRQIVCPHCLDDEDPSDETPSA